MNKTQCPVNMSTIPAFNDTFLYRMGNSLLQWRCAVGHVVSTCSDSHVHEVEDNDAVSISSRNGSTGDTRQYNDDSALADIWTIYTGERFNLLSPSIKAIFMSDRFTTALLAMLVGNFLALMLVRSGIEPNPGPPMTNEVRIMSRITILIN